MTEYLGCITLIAGIYCLIRGCWLGGGYLFAYLVPTIVYTVTAISLFKI